MYRGIEVLANHAKHNDCGHPVDEQNDIDRITGSRGEQRIELRIRGKWIQMLMRAATIATKKFSLARCGSRTHLLVLGGVARQLSSGNGEPVWGYQAKSH